MGWLVGISVCFQWDGCMRDEVPDAGTPGNTISKKGGGERRDEMNVVEETLNCNCT